MTKIEYVDVFPVGVPITRGFTFASGNAGAVGTRAPLVLVRVRDSDGRVGWGQSRPVPPWSYETIESAVTTLRLHLGPAVVGGATWDRVGLHARMFAAIGRGPSDGMPIAKAAIDIAMHDLLARTAGVPLRALLGGATVPVALPLSWTCTAHTAEAVEADVADGFARGLRHFNFKAAVSPESDIAVARQLAALVPPGSFLWADCNQGFTLPDAVRVATAFEGRSPAPVARSAWAARSPFPAHTCTSTARPCAGLAEKWATSPRSARPPARPGKRPSRPPTQFTSPRSHENHLSPARRNHHGQRLGLADHGSRGQSLRRI